MRPLALCSGTLYSQAGGRASWGVSFGNSRLSQRESSLLSTEGGESRQPNNGGAMSALMRVC